MKRSCPSAAGALAALLAIAGCNSSGSSTAVPAAAGGTAQVRFVDGAPLLQTLVGSTPQTVCASASSPCYLRVNGENQTSLFAYGSITPFLSEPAGTLSLVARDEEGYAVGPLKSASLSPGGRYTLVVVGTYPNYEVLTFTEPTSGGAQLSLYEASPTVPAIDFGSFKASTGSGFRKLGSARLGTVSTVALGKSVSDFGAYAGNGNSPVGNGALTMAQINSFDAHNVLPFHQAGRASLFFFDAGNAGGPVFGSLDR